MTGPTSERTRRFDALFAAYAPDIVSYCGWRAATAANGQDAVADVFLTAWRRLDDVPEGEAARAWLYATARRVIANQFRAGRRRAALLERAAWQAPPPAETPAVDREEALVHEALRALPPADREVLLLAEWEDLSAAQISDVLGCLAVTARGRLHRARRRFRAVFDELQAHDPNRPQSSAECRPVQPDEGAALAGGGGA